MKKLSLIALVLILAVCGVGAYFLRASVASAAATDKGSDSGVVTRGDLALTIVETGTIDAQKSVDVKSRVSGRLARLLVHEGDIVTEGQLVAIIDPKETALKVDQDRAVLSGAQSGADRSALELQQRIRTNRAALESAKVRVGQLEAEMKAQPTLTRAAIDQAQTGLDAALQDRALLVTTSQPNAKTTAQSNVDEAQANFDAAKSDFDRQTELLAKGYVSRKGVESARLQFEVARVHLQAAREALSRTDRQFELERAKSDQLIAQSRAALRSAKANAVQDQVKRQDYLSALADLDRARAALEDTQILGKSRDQSMATVRQFNSALSDSVRQLGETDIRAPMSGIVTKKLAEVGDLIIGLSGFSQGTPILRVEDRSGMLVKLDVNEIDVARMTKGMTSKIAVDALPDQSYEGAVTKIAPSSKNSGTTAAPTSADPVVKYEVEIKFSRSDPNLRAGMSAKCSLDVWRRQNVLQVPIEFLGTEGKNHFVMLAPAKPGGKPTQVSVEVGKATGSATEIVGGVTEGAKLVKPPFGGPPRKGAMQFGGD